MYHNFAPEPKTASEKKLLPIMDERITALEKSVSDLTAELKQLGEAISNGFVKTNSNFDNVSKQLSGLREELKVVNVRLSELKGETTDGLENVGVKLENLTEEIAKIGKVTGYDETYKNLEGFN